MKKAIWVSGLILVAVGGAVWWLMRQTEVRAPARPANSASSARDARPAASGGRAAPVAAPTAAADKLAARPAPNIPPGNAGNFEAPPAAQSTPQIPNEPTAREVPLKHPNVAAQRQEEAAGTSQMLVAHGWLRRPEVADPDSDQNRRVLHQMVNKALARAGTSSSAKARNP